jgi:hypothetical protein
LRRARRGLAAGGRLAPGEVERHDLLEVSKIELLEVSKIERRAAQGRSSRTRSGKLHIVLMVIVASPCGRVSTREKDST